MIKQMLTKEYLKKLIVHFSKFTFIGIIASILNILFVWLFIDIFNIKTIISVSLVVAVIFLLKFYLYILIRLIKGQFLKYTFIQVISALLNIVLTWFFIDILLIPTVIATTMVVGGLFIIRFILFKVTRLITN